MHKQFDYLVNKIETAKFLNKPFKHIYIKNFFSQEDISKLLLADQINIPTMSDDKSLIKELHKEGFKAITFPGSVTSPRKYIDWHTKKKHFSFMDSKHHAACEGFGMVFRLVKFNDNFLEDVNNFFASDKLNQTLAKKFDLSLNDCESDSGIQKYLDGYEISPHPDVRRKALTFMININPDQDSEKINYHTKYLKFKKEFSYIERFWSENKKIDTNWVPWSWTENVFTQTKNNSIVIFSPSSKTMHGVKASYNHLISQRTQIYGNLWYKNNPADNLTVEWQNLQIQNNAIAINHTYKNKFHRIIPSQLKKLIKKAYFDRINIRKYK